MILDKNSFVMYTDYMEHIELLSREQRGDLLTAIMAYASEKDLPEIDGMTMMAFSFIRRQMDRDREKYIETVKKRKEAGKLGGRPKANGSDEKAKKANGFSEKQTEAKKPDNDNVNDNDNVKTINTMCEMNALFERLWKLYPNKKGKGQVSDAQKKRLYAIGEPTLVKAIERYSLELQKDADWRKPQNGSTFFNSGYKDYLDENYVPGPEPKKPAAKNKFNNFEDRNYSHDEMLDLERQLLQ